jgi:hypothetical protein
VSLTQVQKDKLADIIAAVPAPTCTPAPTPTPTPIPAPTPVPDTSVGASLAGVPEFAAAHGIPVVNTSRGNMLDIRGRNDFDDLSAQWCADTGGAAMPVITDDEERGIFYQCN